MGITTNAIVIVNKPVGSPWAASLYSADLTGAEDLVAAVAGKNLYVTKMTIVAAAACTITIGAGQTTGVTLIYLGPLPFPATGGNVLEFDWGKDDKAMKIATGVALSVDQATATPCTIYVEGVTV